MATTFEDLDLGPVSAGTVEQITTRLLSPDFPEWSDAVARVGNCAHPIRLIGSSQTINTATGEVIGAYSSEHDWNRVTRIACGNRRASVCPACSRVYAADTWQLISAGAAGGKKGVPESVSAHPMVFATATAPSFGAVHTSSKDGASRCRPRRTRSFCKHGKPKFCDRTHPVEDPAVGQPLCVSCYDYDSQVLWQWHAPELWRRFTIALTRGLAGLLGVTDAGLRKVASVQFAKVAEYQRRGVIHYHALIRLDGPKIPDTPIQPPPANVSVEQFAQLIHDALAAVSVVTDPVDADDTPRRIGFGTQLDTRPVRNTAGLEGDGLSAEQVAGYIAKYATKTITDPDVAEANSPHFARLRATVRDLYTRSLKTYPVEENPFATLGKWESALGFRGHFSTKSRRYSTTLGALRGARRKFRAALARTRHTEQIRDLTELDLDQADDEETTLVIGAWQFAGQGWTNQGETALATAAAVRAREHQQHRAATRVRCGPAGSGPVKTALTA
ncbi:hypothetical protein SAMN05892883_1147 [Jatrophihabitans sp. GAS493]|uniref:replication initiator n=1 Tax=Jatrophihabitans sp. GAS493 TaxID=1907575 RepID=UPI000BC031CF|nr:replication initiator [Jatrophihabitans sp. GAS493]SOD71658.1 hypothetical protein SAMN05892883_1147 [Jatrophihabitans sp. GAS493]